MRRLGSVLSFLVSVACLALFAGGLNNVYGDSREVDRLANQTACGDQDPPCKARMTFWSRDVLGQTFTFTLAARSGAERTVTVTCRRELYVFGEYRCTAPVAALQARADPPAPSATIR